MPQESAPSFGAVCGLSAEQSERLTLPRSAAHQWNSVRCIHEILLTTKTSKGR